MANETYSIMILVSHLIRAGKVARKGMVMQVPAEMSEEVAARKIARGYAKRIDQPPADAAPSRSSDGGGPIPSSISTRDPEPASREPLIEVRDPAEAPATIPRPKAKARRKRK